MGKKGRAIVKIDINELLEELNRAYADEWIGLFLLHVGRRLHRRPRLPYGS